MEKKFIKATKEYCSLDHHVAAPYLRRIFEVPFAVEKAGICICGLGFYRLFINGEEITKGALAPYISNPDDYCYCDTYDLSGLLRNGKNVVGIVLGNGFMNSLGGYVWNTDSAAWRGAPRVALELNVCGKAGETLKLEADTDFRVCPSPILFDDLHYGEYYDARNRIDGWNLPDFDDSAWQHALPANPPRGEFRFCKTEPIRMFAARRPIRIIPCENGYIYDFGINSAGVCEIRIRNSQEGQQLTMRYAEQVRENELFVDSVVFPATRFPDYFENNQKDIYICRGDAEEVWKPSFTYHGFRYVLIEGIRAEQATEDLLVYQEMHSSLTRHGDFHCSDETVNTLFRMTVNSDLSNFYYYPTDCPHREKNGWTGDAALSSFHMMMLYDCDRSFAEWLANVRKSQNDAGALPGIVPTAGWGYDWGNGPAWDCAAFYLPYECWRLRGDTQIARDNAHMMVRYLEYILTRRSADGTIAFGLGDWASVGRRFSKFETPLAVSDSIVVMDIARKAEEMFRAIGHTHSANFAAEIADDLRATVRNRLLDPETCTLAGRTQTGQAMGLYYGVFEADEEQRAFDVLLTLIHENENSFDCGILGLHVLFHVLSRFGEDELALQMITKKEYPSYGHLIEIGETSLPERFMPDGAPLDSHNHHFFGDIARWFIRELAGLRVENSKTVIIRPKHLSSVSSAEAWYDLPVGRVFVRWEIDADGRMLVEYGCPEGVDCSVEMPNSAICRRERSIKV